jgi:hypothetical protein
MSQWRMEWVDRPWTVSSPNQLDKAWWTALSKFSIQLSGGNKQRRCELGPHSPGNRGKYQYVFSRPGMPGH